MYLALDNKPKKGMTKMDTNSGYVYDTHMKLYSVAGRIISYDWCIMSVNTHLYLFLRSLLRTGPGEAFTKTMDTIRRRLNNGKNM